MDPAQLLATQTQNRSFPSLEYVLQGTILDEHVDLLRARLQGLCDNITGSWIETKMKGRYDESIVFDIQVNQNNSMIMK